MIAYQTPVLKIIVTDTENSILTASHEIIPVVPVIPGFTFYEEEQ